MSVIDFKSKVDLGHCIPSEALAYESRTNHLRPATGFSSALQMPLECGTLLQVDQAKLENQGFLRNFRECRQNPNLDRSQRLSPDRDCEERTENPAQPGRNLANSQHHPFRENPDLSSPCGLRYTKSKNRITEPVDVTQLITGQ